MDGTQSEPSFWEEDARFGPFPRRLSLTTMMSCSSCSESAGQRSAAPVSSSWRSAASLKLVGIPVSTNDPRWRNGPDEVRSHVPNPSILQDLVSAKPVQAAVLNWTA